MIAWPKRSSTFMLALALAAASSPAQAAKEAPAGGNLVFAAGYGSSESDSGVATNNVVIIGTMKFAKGQLTAQYREFDANANRKPHQIADVHHDFHAPQGKHACSDKLIEVPSETARRTEQGRWTSDEQGFQITLGSLRYDWRIENDAGALRLQGITDLATGREMPLATGYAYTSTREDFPHLAKDNFAPYYRGEIFHKDNNSFAPTNWQSKQSGLKTSVFGSSNGGDLLSYSSPGQSGTWVANGMLLNHDPASNAVIYQDLGHDFNKNGCYDEYGHTKILLAAHDEGSVKVSRMVYIEYSYTFKGFPMLSVGRYYK